MNLVVLIGLHIFLSVMIGNGSSPMAIYMYKRDIHILYRVIL